MKPMTKGILFVILAAFFWGISGTIAQFLFTKNIQVFQVVQTRSTFAFVFLFIGLLFFKRRSLQFKLKKSFGWLLTGIIGVAGANFTYYYTINLSTVATAILLQYSAPILVMIYSLARKEETVNPYKLFALVLSSVGLYFAIGSGTNELHQAGWLAVLIGFSSAVCFAAMGILGRYLNTSSDQDLLQNLVYTLFFAALFWSFFKFPTTWVDWNLTYLEWLSLIGFSFISVLIPYIFFFSGLKQLQPSTVLIISTVEPICAVISAWYFVGENLDQTQLLGTLLVIGAIVLLGFFSNRSKTQS